MTRLYITAFCGAAIGFTGALTGWWWLIVVGLMLTPVSYLPWGTRKTPPG